VLAALWGLKSMAQATEATRPQFPDWRQMLDMRENYFYDIPPVRTPRRDKGKKRPKL